MTGRRSAGASSSSSSAERGRLSRALGEATWAEADHALALALRDCDGALAAVNAIRRARTAATRAARMEAAESAVQLARQSIAAAARLRRLSLTGAVGQKLAFDPAMHALDREGGASDVRILAPGVVREGRPAQVILRAEARAVRRRVS